MKEQNEQGAITIQEALENYKILRIWHKAVCVISALLLCGMIGFVIWGIFYADLRWILIVFGIVIGICGIVLYLTVRSTCLKAGSLILDYFRVSEKMSEDRLLEKARELKISIKANRAK